MPLITDMYDRGKNKVLSQNQNSFVSWWIQEELQYPQGTVSKDPKTLAEIVMQLNFAGLHTTSLTTTNVFYHILSYKDADALIEELRVENEKYLCNSDSEKTWACLESMTLLDSVIRESLRCTPIDAVAINRKVMKGVETPDGLHLPVGTRVCVPGYLANLDEAHYTDAQDFDPYRFVQANRFEKSWTITENFTTFGYGLHVSTHSGQNVRTQSADSRSKACPGRWFAIAEMKMVVSYFIANYDLDMIPAMPKGFSLATMLIPSTGYEIRIRERQARPMAIG